MKRSLAKSIAAMAAVAAATAAHAQPVPPGQITGTRLELQARGESRVTPDIAVVSAGVVTQSADASTAMRENAARMTRVFAALKQAGIAEKDIQTTSVNLSPQYRYANNEAPVITGYQASNTVSVRFRDMGKSGQVLDVLVKQGANQINGPSLEVESPDDAQDKARLQAIKILQARAAMYAKATGMQVKRIVSISEAVDYSPGPIPMARMAVAAAPPAEKTDISAGEQAIGVNVSIVFELQ
jgi:uncharacterized protein YggE